MELHNFTVGGRDYSAAPMDAFTIASTWPKLVKKLGVGTSSDADVAELLGNLDEDAIKTLIFPILQKSLVTCTTENQKLSSQADFNKLFDHENLFDFYLVVWEVIRLNFAPLLNGLLSQFGLSLADLANSVKANMQKAQSVNPQVS